MALPAQTFTSRKQGPFQHKKDIVLTACSDLDTCPGVACPVQSLWTSCRLGPVLFLGDWDEQTLWRFLVLEGVKSMSIVATLMRCARIE